MAIFKLFAVAAAVGLLGCGGSSGSSDTSTSTLEATLSSIQTNVFTPTCATSGCHAGSGQAGLVLSEGSSFSNLVGVASTESPTLKRVAAGDPNNSYLIQKLEGTATPQMPKGGTPLVQAQINVIRQWIAAGAANN